MKHLADYSPLSPHDTEKHPGMSLLPQDQQDRLISAMNSEMTEACWLVRIQKDKKNRTPLFILGEVLYTASTALQSTILKDDIFSPSELPNIVVLSEILTNERKAEWNTFMQGIMESKDWGKIITPLLREKTMTKGESSSQQDSVIQRQAVTNAWNNEYFGIYHMILLNNINSMSREGQYSNTVAILQSSGTGKSRMVHQQSDLVFTIPFNLRPSSESKELAYPPPDVEIRNYLDMGVVNLEQCMTRYLHLLGHLFRVVEAELATVYTTKQPTYSALCHSWRMFMERDQNRSKIYGEAVKGCIPHHLEELRTMYPISKSDVDTPSVHAVSEEAKAQLRRLLQCIDACCESMAGYSPNNVKLMLYFDEAHILAEKEVPGDLDKKLFYDALCSCFDHFIDQPIFVIFLSTTSSIKELAPPGSLARSARARANVDALQAPITEVPFDSSPNFPIKCTNLKLKDVCEVEFMAQFGRPMFWTLIAGAGAAKNRILPGIIDLARAKLLRNQNINVMHTASGLTAAALTAVLDVLLTLDFEPRREAARRQEAEMVASNMRIAFSVPKDRAYIRSGYPSEPILAEAAARQMEKFQTLSSPGRDTCVMAHMLQSEFSSGLLDQGQRGEVVFRLLASEAYRRAVCQDYPNDSPHIFSKGCRLITFIQQLFSRDCADRILRSIPDNMKDPTTFEQAFKNAVVRFTHFGKMADDVGPTTHTMLAAFIRCMAIICWTSQENVDMLIPVLMEREGDLQESIMTAMLVQIKRRKTRRPKVQYEIHHETVGIFPQDTGNSTDVRPYITLVAELGVQLPISPGAVTKNKVKHKLDSSSKRVPQTPKRVPSTNPGKAPSTPSKFEIPKQPEIQRHSNDTHPRYAYFAYGCSDTVYGVISQSDRPVYKFLLGHRDILDEHPRQDDKTLQAVRAMKPFWSVGEACFGWIDVPYLQNQPEFVDDAGGLTIGGGEDTIEKTDEE